MPNHPTTPRDDEAPDWPTDLVEFERVAGAPEPRADFVDRAFARVFADQSRIADEAERLDERPLPREFRDAFTPPRIGADFVERVAAAVDADRAARDEFWRQRIEAFAVPEISPDFVDRTARRVAADRDEQRSAWRSVLARYAAPRPTGDFVQRTLEALREHAAMPATEPARVLPGPWTRARTYAAVAAAAVVLVALSLWFTDRAPAVTDDAPAIAVMSPTEFRTLLDRVQHLDRAPSRGDGALRPAVHAGPLLRHSIVHTATLGDPARAPIDVDTLDPVFMQALVAEEAERARAERETSTSQGR
jgi:hypothetical protein